MLASLIRPYSYAYWLMAGIRVHIWLHIISIELNAKTLPIILNYYHTVKTITNGFATHCKLLPPTFNCYQLF